VFNSLATHDGSGVRSNLMAISLDKVIENAVFAELFTGRKSLLPLADG
jgi:hypothetical protein